MISRLLLLSILFVGQINAAQENIRIINNTSHSLNVDFTLPQQTVAVIQLKKLEMLHAAILSDSPEKIREAVLDGADINQAKDGKSPLLWAIFLGHDNAAEALLKLGAKADDICVQQVEKMRNFKLYRLLFKQGGAKINPRMLDYFTHQCANLEILDLIRDLVNHGYDPNEMWLTAISLGAWRQSEGEEAVRFLLARGANPNYIIKLPNIINMVQTPLGITGDFPHSGQIVRLLIAAGANINQQIKPYSNGITFTPLAYTIQRNCADKKEVIKLLLEHEASL